MNKYIILLLALRLLSEVVSSDFDSAKIMAIRKNDMPIPKKHKDIVLMFNNGSKFHGALSSY